MPIYDKILKKNLLQNQKSYDLETQGLKLYKVYINGDPGLTLTYFTEMSNLVAYASEWGKLLEYLKF